MTTRRNARILLSAFVVLNAIAVTYPGVTLFNRTRPFVFGLPFIFVWIALWIVLGLVVLIIVEAIETR